MSGTQNNVIEIENLLFRRGKRIILDGINLKVPRGKVVAIMGPSGCGKTTLLKILGGQIKPDAGNVFVDGINVTTASRSALYRLRRRMGMLFQSGALFTDMPVFENVAFPLREHTSLPESMIRDLVLMRLQAVGLRGAHELMPNELSGGMSRRVALARAIALDPDVIMYDEPFAGQDPISMGVLVQLIKLLNDALGLTSIIVSHDVTETASIADYCYILGDGKLMGAGTPEKLLSSNNGSSWVQQFMHGLPDGPVPFHFPARDFADDIIWGSS